MIPLLVQGQSPAVLPQPGMGFDEFLLLQRQKRRNARDLLRLQAHFARMTAARPASFTLQFKFHKLRGPTGSGFDRRQSIVPIQFR